MDRKTTIRSSRNTGGSAKSFARCERGNVAMLFGAAALGILGVVGIAIDSHRQTTANTSLQLSADAIALSLARVAATLTPAELNTRARNALLAMAPAQWVVEGSEVIAIFVSSPKQSLTIQIKNSIPTTFGKMFGIQSLPTNAAATVPLSSKPVQVAMVLDNTGSMNGLGKMTELKRAATRLISSMEIAAQDITADIRLSIVPFAKEVNIGSRNVNATWIDWSSYNYQRRDWSGCVSDREMPNDVSSKLPDNDTDSWYPATNCNLASIMPLSSDWANMYRKIQSMNSSGKTNITIGLAWGMNMLTPGAPLSTASTEPEKYTNYMILLTDGDNTENRFSESSTFIDSRTLQACNKIKAAGIKLFTVRVINGNEHLLRACASSPDMYYNVTDASQISTVFDRIGSTLNNALRLSK